MEIECGGLGEREIGRDLRHEAGDTRELYSGEFESEEFETGDTRSSTFSPYKYFPSLPTHQPVKNLSFTAPTSPTFPS